MLLPQLPGQTYVVDAGNGPGTNYLDLPAAVAAVPDGAVLLVRPGSYTGFAIASKGLTVLGSAAVVQGAVSIGGTAPSQPVTLRGLSWSVLPRNVVPVTPVIALDNCQGPVMLEGVALPANPYLGVCPWPCRIATGIRATTCSQVYLRNCDIRCAVELSAVSAVIESCELSGEDLGAIYQTIPNYPPSGNRPRPALRLNDSDVQVAGASRFESGSGGNLGQGNHIVGASGIVVQNGSLRLLDGTIVAGSSGVGQLAFTVEASGSANLRIAPRVGLTGAMGASTQGPQVGTDVMPALAGSSAAAGGVLSATVTTEDGDLVVLAVGFPAAPTLLAGIQDSFWLDPGAHVFAAIGVQQSGGSIGSAVPVPAGPAFVGLRLNWQAACYGPVTAFQATNPVGVLVR